MRSTNRSPCVDDVSSYLRKCGQPSRAARSRRPKWISSPQRLADTHSSGGDESWLNESQKLQVAPHTNMRVDSGWFLDRAGGEGALVH